MSKKIVQMMAKKYSCSLKLDLFDSFELFFFAYFNHLFAHMNYLLVYLNYFFLSFELFFLLIRTIFWFI